MKRRTTPLAERFWAKVTPEPNTGCLLWAGGTSRKGYGTINLGRAGAGFGIASRVAWELERGPIPAGMMVLHRCDTPACVAVEHLFLGTAQDNSTDMVTKGRNLVPRRLARGERHGNARLTEDQVLAIRKMRATGASFSAIAAEFGIQQSHARGIATGALWSHIRESEHA